MIYIFFLLIFPGTRVFFIVDFGERSSQFCYVLASNIENLVRSSHIMMTFATLGLFIIVSRLLCLHYVGFVHNCFTSHVADVGYTMPVKFYIE